MSNKLSVLKNYLTYAKRAKEIALAYDPSVKVLVFGSVVRGDYTGASDIDLLVISEKEELRYSMEASIREGVPEAPLEVHFATPQQYRTWYSRFIDVFVEV
ncbi:nucleotidyltransferase domain-containing protein [Tardisphaera saccharovorans]